MAERFGGITLDEIAAASRELPFPDDAGASAAVRFVLKVSALVTLRQGKGESGGIAVFLQSGALESDAQGCIGEFNPLLANGNDSISNRVWLSNAALGGAYSLSIDCNDLGVVFKGVCVSGFGQPLPASVQTA